MKKVLFFLVFCPLLAFCQCTPDWDFSTINNTSPSMRTAYVIIEGGQSNMEGNANTASQYPQTGYQDLFFWSGNTTNGFQPVAPQAYAVGINMLGPELQLLKDIRDAVNDTVYLVKYARGGTAVANDPTKDDWNAANNEHLFTLETFANQAKNHLLNVEGYDAVVVLGFFWHNGEEDSKQATWANDYDVNWAAMFNRFKMNTSEPNLQGYLGRIHSSLPASPYAFSATVRQKQDDLQAQGNVIVTDTDALSLNADNIHYDPAGILQLGTLFFNLLQPNL